MKIAKNGKAIKASEEMVALGEIGQDLSPYQCAMDYIYNAIECLGELAKSEDSLARESIANLSVVLLDLKSN